MIRSLQFYFQQWWTRLQQRYFHEIYFYAIILICLCFWLTPKPNLLYSYMPEFIFAGIIAFTYCFPQRNTCIEVFLVGLLYDLISGTPLGITSLLFLVLYGSYARFIIQIKNLGLFIHVIAIAVIVIAEQVLRFWSYNLLSVPLTFLTYTYTALFATFITVLILEQLLMYYGKSRHAYTSRYS